MSKGVGGEETGIGRLQVIQARMQSISFAWPTLKTLTSLYVRISQCCSLCIVVVPSLSLLSSILNAL